MPDRIAQLTAERDAAIARAERAEKALEQMVKPFEEVEIKRSVAKRYYIECEWHSYWCHEAPELTAYLCERYKLENPLETEARNV